MLRPVILLEFNELTPALIDRFIGEGHLPTFERFRSESLAAITDAEEAPPALEPWIQWVSVHTGLSFSEHGVYDLGDGEDLAAPRIWDRVADHGERAFVCSSMNAAITTRNADNVNLIPDPWSVNLSPRPAELYAPFYDFVRSYVQEYTRDKPPLSRSDYARFSTFMIRHGLSPRTVINTVAQLAAERRGAPRWRRAAILDRLLWDVFRSEWKRLSPLLATFFLNSTAHFQHYYWRDMEPERFSLPAKGKDESAAGAILFGYKCMDRILRECIELAGDKATIVFATALGQQAMTTYEETGGKLVFRPRDPTVLLRYAGYEGPFRFSPVMAEQFHLIFESEDDAVAAENALAGLRMDGQPVMGMRRDGEQIFAGCSIIVEPAKEATVTSSSNNRPAPFDTLFYPITGLKSGMHHPDGLLWIRTPERRVGVVERKVSIREIAPTLMELAGLPSDGFALPPMPEITSREPGDAPRRSSARAERPELAPGE